MDISAAHPTAGDAAILDASDCQSTTHLTTTGGSTASLITDEVKEEVLDPLRASGGSEPFLAAVTAAGERGCWLLRSIPMRTMIRTCRSEVSGPMRRREPLIEVVWENECASPALAATERLRAGLGTRGRRGVEPQQRSKFSPFAFCETAVGMSDAFARNQSTDN